VSLPLSQRFWVDSVRRLAPYVPGEQPKIPDLIKLNTNENPFGPSPRVLKAISESLDEQLKLYPDPQSTALRATVADYYRINVDQVFVGNGSDEVLAFVFRAFFSPEKPLVYADITYSFYPVYCGLYGLDSHIVPLDDDLAIDVPALLKIDPTTVSGLILPNPNAPTGRLLDLNTIGQLAAHFSNTAVVIDEAYIDFGGRTAVALIDQYPNLLVTQSLSKSRSLAGLRIGMAMGNAGLIEALHRIKDSFNSYPLDRLAQAGAKAAFEDEDYFQHCCQQIMTMRDQLSRDLQSRGFEVVESAANFVFARHPKHSGAALAAGLREHKVIVRHFDKPRISEYLRISIGNAEQNQALLAALDAVMAK